MTSPTRTSLGLTIVALDPPFGSGDGVLFGLQSGRAIDDPVPACATTEFCTTIEVVPADDPDVDFRGEHVHGRRGDRFIYVSWGLPAETEPFVMFARAKIKLADIPGEILDGAIEHGHRLVCEMEATNAKGQPASGTLRPAAIQWHTS